MSIFQNFYKGFSQTPTEKEFHDKVRKIKSQLSSRYSLALAFQEKHQKWCIEHDPWTGRLASTPEQIQHANTYWVRKMRQELWEELENLKVSTKVRSFIGRVRDGFITVLT